MCTRLYALAAVGRALNPRPPLQIFGELARETRDLVQLVDRLEAPDALAVGEQAGGLRHGEAVAAQLLEADAVEVDLLAGLRRRRRLRWLRLG
jgi:hypothetical protein